MHPTAPRYDNSCYFCAAQNEILSFGEPTSTVMTNTTKGYIFGAASAITYGLNPLFALPLYSDGMNPDSVLFFRYLMAIPVLGIMIRWRRHSFRLNRSELPAVICLGLLMALSSLTLFLSYTYMAAGIASTILFVYPVMVALIMAIFYKEKVTPITGISILLALTGIVLLYHGEDGETLSLTGVIMVLLSGLAYAIYMVWINRPKIHQIPTVRLTFYVLTFGLSIFAVRLLCGCSDTLVEAGMGAKLTTPSTAWLWINQFCLALFPTAISFICTTRAIQYVGSTVTAILGALEPITAVFFGVIIFHEALTPRLMGGILLVIFAVSLIIAGGNLAKKLLHFRKLFPKGKLKG
jgi:drug/metabolite transporter (DMT)-like permease